MPFNWTGPPLLLWAPTSDAGAAAVVSNLTSAASTNLFLPNLLISPAHVVGFEDEASLEEWYLANPARVWAAVVFNSTPSSPLLSSSSSSASSSSSFWQYSLRINGSYAPTTDPSLQLVEPSNYLSVGHNESRKCV